MNTYCIREDYQPRTEAETFVDDPTKFWNESRIATSGFYQYYVYKMAAEQVSTMDSCSFADIGCGYPRKTRELIAPLTNDITLVDQPSMKGLIEERFPAMKFVPLNLEKNDTSLKGQFHCLVCADVIEHLLDPDPLLAFIRQLLAPGGIAIISTPERDIERGPDCLSSPKAEHVREWNANEFARYIASSGFDVQAHALLPAGRISKVEEMLLPLLRSSMTSRYCGCQAVVCTVA